jgi:hypothetical protein
MSALTEEEWLTGGDPFKMLARLHKEGSDRKLRLFACACVRQVWSALVDEISQRAVEVAERYADGQASREELLAVHAQASEVSALADLRLTASDPGWAATRAATRASDPARDVFRAASGAAFLSSISAAPWLFDPNTGNALGSGDPDCKALARWEQCELLRELFGNPFQPVRFDPAWRTHEGGLVLHMAREIYDDKRFTHLPVLADLLEEAGCGDERLLAHLHQPGKHLRGCWALDRVLGLN